MGRSAKRKKALARAAGARGTPGKRQMTLVESIKLFLARNQIWLRPGLVFACCVGVSIFVFSRLVETNALFGFLAFTAQSTGFVLNALGNGVQIDGSRVSSGDFSIMIVNECTAIVPMIILLSAIVAYPSRMTQKVLGLAIGLPGLFLINLVRTVSLFYIGTWYESFLDTAHLLIWQPVMVLAVIVIWYIWAEKVVHVRKA